VFCGFTAPVDIRYLPGIYRVIDAAKYQAVEKNYH